MLEQLLSLIKENAHEGIVQNPQVPNEHNEEVMNTLMSSITGGIQNEAQAGNLQGIMGLLSGKEVNSSSNGIMDNPVVGSIAKNAIASIMQKFGLNNSAASGIVASVLPGVLRSVISKVSNPNDSSIDFNSVLGSLMGGGTKSQSGDTASGFDFNQIGYALADGKLDMNDLMRVGGSFFGNSNKQQSQSGGAGLGGLLGGLFGK